MRTFGTTGQNAQQELTQETQDKAASSILNLSVPEYIFPEKLRLGLSKLSSTGEQFFDTSGQ